LYVLSGDAQAVTELYAKTDKYNKSGKITKEHLEKALARRPWNAKFKTLCWKISESFVKQSSNDACYYGKIYLERKAYETAKNDAGDYAKLAAVCLEKNKNKPKMREACKVYRTGKLPSQHIVSRCMRYAVKLFLAHLHEVWYRLELGKEPPMPYAIAYGKHVHKIDPPDPDGILVNSEKK